MSNIANAFKNGKAFIPFFTCGFPDMETSKAAIKAAVDNGADLIELGIPFSDPTAEGPVIQRSTLGALKNGVNTNKIFKMVKELRQEVTIPLVFMTYANVVFSYGGEDFFANHGVTILDGGKVVFGNHVLIGPGCGFHTAGHPLLADQRNRWLVFNKPITVGDNVWFGAGVQVLPGVSIGDNVVVAAGSVVTHDLPSGCVAAGNPCKVLREITDDDRI